MIGRPNLILLTGEESRENFSSLQIAELVNDGDDNYTLVEEFIPTAARINASPRLSALIQSLTELFSAKVRVLNERRKQLSAQIATFGHTDVSNFLVLQTLSGAIPVLRHYRENPQLHPEQLYQLLARVIGQLCPFSFDVDVHSIPKYRHTDLTKTFDGVEKQLRGLIDVAMPEKMASLQLVKEADLLWSVDNIDSTYLANNDFYIAVLSPMDDPMWVKHFEKIAKVGARADIEMIVASAMPGVRLTHMQRPPSNLPIKSGYEYFRIEPKGDFWKRIHSEQTMGIYLPKAFRKVKMEIVLVPRA
jgi:type VI secretion system protein ImpJ